MNYHQGDLAEAIVRWVSETGCVDKVLAIDLETKVMKGGFLSGEPILCVSTACFEYGKIKKTVLILDEESLEAEERLFGELDEFLAEKRPLILLGYNLCGYDIPLLHLRLRKHTKKFWAIQDAITRTFPLDMMHPIRFEMAKYFDGRPKILPLAKVVNHECFAELPLMRTKYLVPEVPEEKGAEIYRLWKEDRKKFVNYAQGDAHDVLVIFKELYKDVLIS